MESTQLLKGVLDLAVLSVLRDGDGYGYEIVTTLRERGLEDVGEASVYGTLRRLADDGLIAAYVVPSDSGPNRKYYRLTAAGRNARTTQAKTWRRFTEIMHELVFEEDR